MVARTKDILKQDDEFVSFWMKVIGFIYQHKNYFYIALAVVVAAGLVIWGLTYYRGKVEAGAWAAYESIMDQPPAQSEDAAQIKEAKEKTQADLIALIGERSGTKAALQAHLELAGMAAQESDYPRAIEHYEIFLKGLPAHDPIRPATAQAIGQVYEAMGDLAKAAEWYHRVAESAELADLGLWDLGRVQELAGQKEEARKTFQRLLNQHPNSIYASVVQQRLLNLDQ